MARRYYRGPEWLAESCFLAGHRLPVMFESNETQGGVSRGVLGKTVWWPECAWQFDPWIAAPIHWARSAGSRELQIMLVEASGRWGQPKRIEPPPHARAQPQARVQLYAQGQARAQTQAHGHAQGPAQALARTTLNAEEQAQAPTQTALQQALALLAQHQPLAHAEDEGDDVPSLFFVWTMASPKDVCSNNPHYRPVLDVSGCEKPHAWRLRWMACGLKVHPPMWSCKEYNGLSCQERSIVQITLFCMLRHNIPCDLGHKIVATAALNFQIS